MRRKRWLHLNWTKCFSAKIQQKIYYTNHLLYFASFLIVKSSFHTRDASLGTSPSLFYSLLHRRGLLQKRNFFQFVCICLVLRGFDEKKISSLTNAKSTTTSPLTAPYISFKQLQPFHPRFYTFFQAVIGPSLRANLRIVHELSCIGDASTISLFGVDTNTFQ